MYKNIATYCLLLTLSAAAVMPTYAGETKIPASFFEHTASAQFEINYDDLDALLNASVLRMGKSTRAKAKESKANIGTRMRNNVNKLTALEGNRFYYEAFKKDDKKAMITAIRKSLEQLPNDADLSLFTKDEQLAYWLNLYNVTLLDELVKIYPTKNLEDVITGRNSVLDKKLLTVAGVKLSLNDIHHKILMKKYDKNPLIMYGLYQGIIGGPDIMKQAFTGENVYRLLARNANSFINSNRGTYADKKKSMRVSSLYKRNADYFDNFNADLKEHLLTYLEGYTRYQLEEAKKIKANISDWNITDLYGTTRKYGSGTNNNMAALQDSVSNENTQPSFKDLQGSGIFVDLAMMSSTFQSKSLSFGRFTQEQALKLKQLNDMKRVQSGSVTITDLNEKKSDNSQ